MWSIARLADGDCRDAAVDVNGFELSCVIPLDPEPEPSGATPFAAPIRLVSTLAAKAAVRPTTSAWAWPCTVAA